jgi:hypothetical protein
MSTVKRLASYILRFFVVVGVLAFIFCAISPDDDSTQPDSISARNVSQLSMLCFDTVRCSSSCGKCLSAISLSFSLQVLGTSLGDSAGFSLRQLPMVPLSLPSERGPPFCWRDPGSSAPAFQFT